MSRPTLARLGEFGLIDRLRRRLTGGKGVEIGPGDDAAVVRIGGVRLVLTTDALVEDVHFRRGWESPARLGKRAFRVNASDVAAMGGRPRWALLALGTPPATAARDLEALVGGFAADARKAGVSLIGGNLTRSARWSITVALVGEAPSRPLLRSGARTGDLLCVSGPLGGVAFARERLLGGRGSGTLPLPPLRLELGARLARRGLAHAAIDVSDGLLQDLGQVCRASGVGAEVDTKEIPFARALRSLPRATRLRLALRGGEDYELLFTIGPARRRAVERLGASVIGRIVTRRGIQLVENEWSMRISARGYDHFENDR